jgi:hypothetical protein
MSAAWIDIIHIHSDRVFLRVSEVIQPYAAKEKIDHAGFSIRDRKIETGRHRHDIGIINEAQLTDLGVGEGGDRDAYVLKILFAPLRGNNDLFKLLRI